MLQLADEKMPSGPVRSIPASKMVVVKSGTDGLMIASPTIGGPQSAQVRTGSHLPNSQVRTSSGVDPQNYPYPTDNDKGFFFYEAKLLGVWQHRRARQERDWSSDARLTASTPYSASLFDYHRR